MNTLFLNQTFPDIFSLQIADGLSPCKKQMVDGLKFSKHSLWHSLTFFVGKLKNTPIYKISDIHILTLYVYVFFVKYSVQSLKLKHGVRYWTNFLTFSFFINCDSFDVTTELIEKKNVYLQQLKRLLPEALPSSFEVKRSKRSKGLRQKLDLQGILYPHLPSTKTGMYHSSLVL